MPLKVIVVGAGIAGLTASIALRQAGHQVEVFEKSQFANEVGAALIVSPNGARVLSQLGFSFLNARAVEIDQWRIVHGNTQEPITSVDLRAAKERFGEAIRAVHRVDLHNELLRLASSDDKPGHPVRLHLASDVSDASIDGSITLQDGSKHTADLIVAADGLHSGLKRVVDETSTRPTPTGLSAFRFLIDTHDLSEPEQSSTTSDKKGHGAATLLADTVETSKERHIVWYPCRDGLTQNFVGIHPSRDVNGDDAEAVRKVMLDEFSQFSTEILDMIRRSSHVKCWPLSGHKPLSDWYTGRIVLIGDAAHPMLPFGGQGSNCAIEDGGALGYLFQDTEDTKAIPEKLRLFQLARQARATRVQILSSVRAGREKEVEEQLLPYADPAGTAVPTNLAERTVHDYSFDVFQKCKAVLEAEAVAPLDAEQFFLPSHGTRVTAARLKTLLEPLMTKRNGLINSYTIYFGQFDWYLQHFNQMFSPIQVGISQYGGRLISRSVATEKNEELTAAYHSINNQGGQFIGVGINASAALSGYPVNAVYPGWRTALIDITLTTPWNFTAPWDEMIANQDLMTDIFIAKLAELTPNGSCYLNEGDFGQPDFQSVFYGSNYQKLNEIRNMYDPHHTFYALTAVGSEYWVPQSDGRLCASG